MKTLQKYTSIALLLISATTIVPAYANPTIDEQDQVEQKETTVEQKSTETVWYKRPEVREKIYGTLTIVGCIVVISVLADLMAKKQTRVNNPEYQWKVNGHVMRGWEVIDGNLIKKAIKICPGCCTCNNN